MREFQQSPRKHAVLLRVSEAAYRKLKRAADSHDLSIAELLRWAVEEWFDTHDQPRRRKKRR